MHDLLPLLLGVLLRGVEVGGGEEPVVDGVFLGRRLGEHGLQLRRDTPQQLHLGGLEGDDHAVTAPFEAGAHDGCSNVAHSP